jgi:cytochrome P450
MIENGIQLTHHSAHSQSSNSIRLGKIERCICIRGMQYRPIETLSNLFRKYGQVVKFDDMLYIISDPNMAEIVLSKTTSFERLTPRHQLAADLWGTGLVLREGPDWLRQRRILHPIFQSASMLPSEQTIVRVTEQMLLKWQDGSIRGLHKDLMRITFTITARNVFSDGITHQELTDITQGLEHIYLLFDEPKQLNNSATSPEIRGFYEAIGRMDEIIYRIIGERKNRHNGDQDLLDTLMKLRDEHGQYLTDKQIRDEIVAILRSGHKNDAITLTWAFSLLSQNADVREKLQCEMDEVLGDRSPTFCHRAENMSYKSCQPIARR